MQIRPDVYLISGKASNFYLCVDQQSLTLIDAGLPKEQHLLFDLLSQLDFQPSQVEHILVTHADIDHVGSLAALQSATGATIYASAESANLLQLGISPQHLPRPVTWILNTFLKYKPVPEACLRIVEDGDKIPLMDGMTVLATPGHTLDHLSFYCPSKGVLFAGDALHTRKDQLQRSGKRITADDEKADRSAIRLLELAPATFACGHGKPKSNHQMGDLMVFFDELRQE